MCVLNCCIRSNLSFLILFLKRDNTTTSANGLVILTISTCIRAHGRYEFFVWKYFMTSVVDVGDNSMLVKVVRL